MRKFHIAIGVADVDAAVSDYSERLQAEPVSHIAGEYALWRTPETNFSIRQVSEAEGSGQRVGQVRHIGFEDSEASEFSTSIDANGLLWEHFTAEQQAEEINQLWPSAAYVPER